MKITPRPSLSEQNSFYDCAAVHMMAVTYSVRSGSFTQKEIEMVDNVWKRSGGKIKGTDIKVGTRFVVPAWLDDDGTPLCEEWPAEVVAIGGESGDDPEVFTVKPAYITGDSEFDESMIVITNNPLNEDGDLDVNAEYDLIE